MKPIRSKFDYDSPARGFWATLACERRVVTMTEYPGTLLAMYRAGVLSGEALADAERLVVEETDGRIRSNDVHPTHL